MSTSAMYFSAPATAARINWGPYIAGAGIGVLSWIVFVAVNTPIGITTTIGQVSGGVASLAVGADIVAAIGAGSVHAFVGAFGMILGGILYALTFDWVSQDILPVWAMGKVQLPQLLEVGAPMIFGALGLLVIAFFVMLERSSGETRRDAMVNRQRAKP